MACALLTRGRLNGIGVGGRMLGLPERSTVRRPLTWFTGDEIARCSFFRTCCSDCSVLTTEGFEVTAAG
jgi:hypothetical protein